LLYLQVSKVLVSYGQHVLNVQQVSDPYNDKYKGIWICLQVGFCRLGFRILHGWLRVLWCGFRVLQMTGRGSAGAAQTHATTSTRAFGFACR
jgi:hypothetical protein